jgi:hypothetical protein
MLLWKGITTYEFIVLEQKRLRDKQQAESAQRANRQVSTRSLRRNDDIRNENDPSGSSLVAGKKHTDGDPDIEMALKERQDSRDEDQTTDRSTRDLVPYLERD